MGTIESGYDPDGLYGLAKLAAELTLQEMYKENGIESVSCRFFTVYGPRAKENHAIISGRCRMSPPIRTAITATGSAIGA